MRRQSLQRRLLFSQIDLDGDGFWTAEEVRAAFGASFEGKPVEELDAFVRHVMALDSNNDGLVSYSEFSKWVRPPR